MQDVPIAIYYGPDFPGLHAVGEPVAPGYYVAYVRKATSALRDALNAAIESAIADGTLERIYKKYGVWNDDQLQLADVAKNWPPAAAAAAVALGQPRRTTLGMLLRAAWTTIQLSFLVDAAGDRCSAWWSRSAGCTARWWIRVPFEAYVELLRGTPLLAATVRDLLRAAAAHRREPARVLGRRAGPGDQLLGLRSGELPRRPAGHSARSDGGRPVARHEHAAPRSAA